MKAEDRAVARACLDRETKLAHLIAELSHYEGRSDRLAQRVARGIRAEISRLKDKPT